MSRKQNIINHLESLKAAVIALNEEWYNINIDSDLEMKLREFYPFNETDTDLIESLNEWIENVKSAADDGN